MSPESPEQCRRSLLFAPGIELRKLEKFPSTGADGLIIDLEDAVAPDSRPEARQLTGGFLNSLSGDPFVVVRVNAGEEMAADLEAVVRASLSAVMVPKAESAADLLEAGDRLAVLERSRGLEPGSVALFALIETPRGVAESVSIADAAVARPLSLAFGPGDFALELDVEPEDGNPTLLHARTAIVIASRAAGLGAPIDGPFLRLEDEDGLRDDSARSRAMGFGGRLVLHPRQVGTVNDTYSELSAAAARHISRAIAHFEAVSAQGVVSTVFEGEFLDPPIVDRMRRKLNRRPPGDT